MMLGHLLDRLGDDTVAAELLVELGDLHLLAEVDTMCMAFDESRGQYASAAVRRFTRLASDEDWLGLMTALERGDDGASACLTRMVDFALKEDRRLMAAQASPPDLDTPPAGPKHGHGHGHGGCGCGGSGGCGG